jgi:hypothetical protein
MNKLNLLDESTSNLPAHLSETNQTFCDNLLALAKWLDSQEQDCQVYRSPLKQQGIVIHSAWKSVMIFVSGEKRYYNQCTTNKERVLAVLMLRSAILAGDSFV